MSKLKFALAMLAAGGAVGAASEASAATTIILDIDSHATLTDISLEGGPAQFFYNYDSTVDKTYLGAYGDSLLLQPPPFGTGAYSHDQVKTAYNFNFKSASTYKGIGSPGDGFVNLKFTEGTQGFHGFADITPAGDLHSITYSAGIPEPAAWALMIAGFGLTGAALRRSRQAPLNA